MAKAPAAGKARTKSKDTDGAPPIPVLAGIGSDSAEVGQARLPVPDDTTAPADVAAGAERATSTAGSDPVGDAAATGTEAGGEAGKGDGAAAGTAPDPDHSSAPQLPAAVERISTALFGSDPDGVEVIIVTGPEKGRRRCGVRFGPEPETIPIPLLRPGELEAIESDPELKVTRDFRKYVPR